MKPRKTAKPEKVTFEAVAHHLPEGYFEQSINSEIEDELREDFEKRIRKANRNVGVKTSAVLDKRSKGFQHTYAALKALSLEDLESFETMCSEVQDIEHVVGSYQRDSAFYKLAEKYTNFEAKGFLIVDRQGRSRSANYCFVPGMSIALDFCRSIKSKLSYSELL